MALIHCTECGAEISDKAVTCPYCGATKAKVRAPRKTAPKKSNLPWKAGTLLAAFFLISAGVYFAKSDIQKGGLPKPRVIQSSLDNSRSSMLKLRTTIRSTILNEGSDGTIAVTFHVYQKDKEYVRKQLVSLAAGEKQEVEAAFDEVRLLDGTMTHRVEAKAN